MWAPSTEETYFAIMDHTKNVVHIMPSVEMMVTFSGDRDAIRAKKACVLYAERIDFKELIVSYTQQAVIINNKTYTYSIQQLRLTEKSDQRRMYITTVDSASFHQLKQDQSLNVTFVGFMENVVRMLKDCQAGKLELHLSKRDCTAGSDNSNSQQNHDYLLQFD